MGRINRMKPPKNLFTKLPVQEFHILIFGRNNHRVPGQSIYVNGLTPILSLELLRLITSIVRQ